MWNRWGNSGDSGRLYLFASKITADRDCSHGNKRLFGRNVMTNLDSILKSRDVTLLTKVHPVKAMVFFCSHVSMWELDHKEGWVLKNCCFWIVVLEKTLGSPLDKTVRRANQLILKKNQSWIFIGRTDAEGPILWAPDAKNLLIGKDCDAGKIWRQKEKGATEDVMVR